MKIEFQIFKVSSHHSSVPIPVRIMRTWSACVPKWKKWYTFGGQRTQKVDICLKNIAPALIFKWWTWYLESYSNQTKNIKGSKSSLLFFFLVITLHFKLVLDYSGYYMSFWLIIESIVDIALPSGTHLVGIEG